jgi:hypothetical protein
VLHLLANHLLVSLSKNNIALVYTSGLSKRVLADHHMTWQSQENFNWQEVIYRLERTLDDLNLPAHTKLSVTLSTDMVRYLTLPAQTVSMNAEEKVAYANAAYQEIYGFATSEWKIKCHDAPPNEPMLTSAIDTALFEAIQMIATKYDFKLKSVQPYLMTAMNALDGSLKGADTIFAVVESNRILIVNLQNGYCTQVRTYPRSANWQNTLSQLLTRETLIGAENMREILVYAPAQGKAVIPFADDWLVKPLQVKRKKVSDEPHYAMLEALA